MQHQARKHYDDMISKIRQEKQSFMEKAFEKDPYADMDTLLKQFRCEKIDNVIQKWCDIPIPKEKRVKYGRKTNSRKKLADIIGISAQYLTDISKGSKFPSRDMMLSLAVGMKLSFEERVEFMMYHDDDRNYPSTMTEELIEKCIEESGYCDSEMPFLTFNNDYVYERLGHKYSLYKGGEKEETQKSCKNNKLKETAEVDK